MSNPYHQHLDCLFNSLFWVTSKKTSVPCYEPFVRGIHRSPVDSPHKGPATRKPFPCDNIIMTAHLHCAYNIVKTSVTVYPIKCALFELHCWLSQSQSSNLNYMGKIRQCLTIAKHQLYKAQIFVKIPCSKLQMNVLLTHLSSTSWHLTAQ